MERIKSGFEGERFVAIPQSFLELAKDSPLSGDLYISSLGHIPHARYHHAARAKGWELFTFLYVTYGKGVVEVEGLSYTLSANQYMVIPSGVKYSYRSDNDDPWTIYWISFGGAKGQVFASAMTEPRTIPPSVSIRIEQRTELFDSMIETLGKELSIDRLNLANTILAMFLALFLYSDLVGEGSKSKVRHAEGVVSSVTHFMNENVETNLSLARIASFAGYSQSYLYRKFIKETGYAPVEYFIMMKVNKASIYLIKTNMTVRQIASKLGFNSADYFSRTFRRVVGIPPSEFRAQNFRL